MEKKALLRKLNWFYSLEINQVALYQSQSREAGDPHLARALRKFAEIEQGHVENIRETIEKLGETPTLIGEVAGAITGKIAGRLTSLSSRERTLRFNIALEKKAIIHYKELIGQVDDPAVKDLLWNNMIDEELHTFWMLRKVAQRPRGLKRLRAKSQTKE